MDLNDLRRKRKAAAEAMHAAATAFDALEGDTATTPEALAAAQTEFDTAKAAFETAKASVERAEEAESALALSATSEIDTPPAGGGNLQPGQVANADAKGADTGLMVAALANAGGNRDQAVDQLEAAGHTQIAATLTGATSGAGGVLIPRPQSEVLIQLLKPKVVVRKLGAVSHDMPAGKLRKGRTASAPTAGYIGENAPIVESEPTFDNVDQDFKTLTALVPIGNALLSHSSVSIGMMVRDLLLDYMALREDLAFIRGDGSGNTPKGLLNWCLAGHKQTGIANTVAAVELALRKMVSTLDDANVPMLNPGWIMRGATKHFLASLRDPNSGAKIYPSIDASNTLHGFPIETTSQVPNNLAPGTATEITFADFSEIMIGDDQEIRVASSTEASFVDTNGDTISAFQRDLTLMRAVSRHDLAPVHDEAIAVTTGIGWGL
ncbi:phage major capsid protein [Ruegeria litorea]|uniref:Phage major capsid protein n=1 Tax=Falsiruegeria litorea TaxID=1280831 RepID=A0ABS5WUU5_9RHOB|nr:phage major capsid protein [Falsiruegeria litorea]MBT3142909.1 phage major capsid protein [Falsiruegeria litorea]